MPDSNTGRNERDGRLREPSFLVFTIDYKPCTGGIAEHAYKVAHALKRRGSYVAVLAPHVDGCEEFDRQAGLLTVRVRQKGLWSYLPYLWALSRMVREHGIDYVYCATFHPCTLICAVASVFASFEYAVAIHGFEVIYRMFGLRQTLKSFLRPLRTFVFNQTCRVFAVSRFTRDNAIAAGVMREKIRVIYNGIDFEDFEDLPDAAPLLERAGLSGKRIILTVGRLIARKGHDTVIRALQGILDAVPDTVYVIAGDGPERPRLERLAERTGVSEHVFFLGELPRSEILGMLSACDVFTMVSRQIGNSVEGFGIVYLEAAALRKPVVGGRSGGVPDAVEDGVTGLLVEPGDTAAVSEAITRILLDPGLARRLGEAGYERTERLFTWDMVAERIAGSL
jgi:phosphatidylinositol alpha-1,6-mannosyltransferase